MIKNIVLIGMMGSGKTSIAKALAKLLKCKSISTDELIVKKSKKSINAIVASNGWEHFRKLEHDIILQLAKKKSVIIDTGGGVVLNPDNMRALRMNGIIIFIKAGPTAIYQRIKDDTSRPLIQVEKPLAAIRKLYKERLALYEQADLIIPASSAPVERITAKIIACLKAKKIVF